MRILTICLLALLAACGGDATDEESAAEIADANGLPAGESIDCRGGDVVVTTGGPGDVVATGGDGGGCAAAGEDEDDETGGFVDDGQPVPPFLGP